MSNWLWKSPKKRKVVAVQEVVAVHEVAGLIPEEETEMKVREVETVQKVEAATEVMEMTDLQVQVIVPEEEVQEVINQNLIVHAEETNHVMVVEKELVVVVGENNFEFRIQNSELGLNAFYFPIVIGLQSISDSIVHAIGSALPKFDSGGFY